MALPVFRRTGPAKGGDTIKSFSPFQFGAAPYGGQIRQQTGVPEQERYGKIRRDGEHVPQQRRVEVRPERPTRIGIRHYKEGHPYTTHIPDGELTVSHNGDNA